MAEREARAETMGKTMTEMKFAGKSLQATGTTAERLGMGAARFGAARRTAGATTLAELVAASGRLEATATSTGNLNVKALGASTQVLNLLGLLNYQPVTNASSAHDDAGHSTTLNDKTVSPMTEYIYQVVAVDSDGLTSAPSSPLDATPFKVHADPPQWAGAPAYDASKHAITLTWVRAPDTLGYFIERSSDNGATFSALTAMLPDAGFSGANATYLDYSARSGQTYQYRITIVDTGGNKSDPSAVKTTQVPQL